jgi:hypothetical protein
MTKEERSIIKASLVNRGPVHHHRPALVVLQLTGSGAAVGLVILCFDLPGVVTGRSLGVCWIATSRGW